VFGLEAAKDGKIGHQTEFVQTTVVKRQAPPSTNGVSAVPNRQETVFGPERGKGRQDPTPNGFLQRTIVNGQAPPSTNGDSAMVAVRKRCGARQRAAMAGKIRQ